MDYYDKRGQHVEIRAEVNDRTLTVAAVIVDGRHVGRVSKSHGNTGDSIPWQYSAANFGATGYAPDASAAAARLVEIDWHANSPFVY